MSSPSAAGQTGDEDEAELAAEPDEVGVLGVKGEAVDAVAAEEVLLGPVTGQVPAH